jgi:hypothetical protein
VVRASCTIAPPAFLAGLWPSDLRPQPLHWPLLRETHTHQVDAELMRMRIDPLVFGHALDFRGKDYTVEELTLRTHTYHVRAQRPMRI